MAKLDAFAIFTRVGFAARGVLYVAIAALVIAAGQAEDPGGAVAYLGTDVGQWLVALMACGFAAYGLWRLADAAFGTEHPGNGNKAIVERIGAAASGLVHLFLAYQSAQLALGGTPRGGGGAEQQAATVLHLPAGQILLAAVAIGLGVAGVTQLVNASKCSFLETLDPRVRDTWVKWLGRIGHAARGIVFLIAAYFLLAAALDARSDKAAGMEQILQWLSSPVDLIVATGLFLFGLYSFVEARYRLIRTPDPDRIRAELRS